MRELLGRSPAWGIVAICLLMAWMALFQDNYVEMCAYLQLGFLAMIADMVYEIKKQLCD